MKNFFLIIAIFLIIIMFLNTEVVEGLTNISLSRHTSQSSGSSRNTTSGVRNKIGRTSTSAQYTHPSPTASTSSWNNATGQWNN